MGVTKEKMGAQRQKMVTTKEKMGTVWEKIGATMLKDGCHKGKDGRGTDERWASQGKNGHGMRKDGHIHTEHVHRPTMEHWLTLRLSLNSSIEVGVYSFSMRRDAIAEKAITTFWTSTALQQMSERRG